MKFLSTYMLKIKSKILLKKMIPILMIIGLLFILSSVHSVESTSTSLGSSDSAYGIDKNKISKNIAISSNKKYVITPTSKNIDKEIAKYTTYNKYTKDYYNILGYMKKFEKSGGGTLVFKKGKYTITNAIPVPSNVNLVFENGVVIEKGLKTGTSKFKASESMFQLVHPSKLKSKNLYKKYNGVRNVNFIGKGTATIDLKYASATAIVCGHNQNINIQGITFKNLYSGHFIELDATNKMTVTKCKFIGSKATSKFNAEAINLDIPDKNTKGFNFAWTSNDKTSNNNILIENNAFNTLDRAIGSHKYSQNKYNGQYVANKGQIYHNKIIIRNNKITNIRSDAIKALNWKNVEITNNYIEKIPKNSKNYRGILANGVINIKIKNNYFVNMYRPVQIMPTKNNGVGSMYAITYNTITNENLNDLKNNLCSKVSENFVYVSNSMTSFYKNVPVINMIIQ